jgi:hypothetical protein
MVARDSSNLGKSGGSDLLHLLESQNGIDKVERAIREPPEVSSTPVSRISGKRAARTKRFSPLPLPISRMLRGFVMAMIFIR